MEIEKHEKILTSVLDHKLRLDHFFALKQSNPDKAFERSFFYPGHYTASAVVVNHKLEKILLTHHKKLNIWLQLGGHADGDQDLFRVACREMIEESGLIPKTSFFWKEDFLKNPHERPSILDVSVHEIPPFKSEPKHLHFDARYLFFADDENEKICISDESNDLRWFDLDEVLDITEDVHTIKLIAQLKKMKVETETWIMRNFELDKSIYG